MVVSGLVVSVQMSELYKEKYINGFFHLEEYSFSP